VNIGSKSEISLERGPVDPIYPVQAVAPTNHSSSHKTRLKYFVWYKYLDRTFFVFLQCMRLTDERTDMQFSPD